jgi:hypothetical protein
VWRVARVVLEALQEWRDIGAGEGVGEADARGAVRAALRNYVVESTDLDPTRFLFGTRHGRQWHRKRIEKICRAWGAAAGVRDCHPIASVPHSGRCCSSRARIFDWFRS